MVPFSYLAIGETSSLHGLFKEVGTAIDGSSYSMDDVRSAQTDHEIGSEYVQSILLRKTQQSNACTYISVRVGGKEVIDIFLINTVKVKPS